MGHRQAAGGVQCSSRTTTNAFRRSIGDPESFWGQAAAAIDWYRPAQRVLDRGRDQFTRWFFGGELNTCHNCLDRHVNAGRGDRVVLIYDNPVTSTVRTHLPGDVGRRVAAGRRAGRLGVGRGDRVVSCMPMLPQAVMAMLACTRLGAVRSMVFGGIAAEQLARRIEDAQPKVVLSASCGIESGRVRRTSRCSPDRRRPPHSWQAVTSTRRSGWPVRSWPNASRWRSRTRSTSSAPRAPLGRPKGIVCDNGGHAVALHWSMHNIYGTGADDV